MIVYLSTGNMLYTCTPRCRGHIKLSKVKVGDHFDYQNNISLVPSRRLS